MTKKKGHTLNNSEKSYKQYQVLNQNLNKIIKNLVFYNILLP
jgi:hypothetical protein